MRIVTGAAVAVLLGGCAAPRVGHVSADEFESNAVEQVLLSRSPASAVARCFEAEARLLPFSSVRYEPDLQQITYRLQGYGLWLEEASFRDLPDGSSEVRFRHAANYERRWLRSVRDDRLEPLRRCAERAS